MEYSLQVLKFTNPALLVDVQFMIRLLDIYVSYKFIVKYFIYKVDALIITGVDSVIFGCVVV